jgi:hypothetical protein
MIQAGIIYFLYFTVSYLYLGYIFLPYKYIPILAISILQICPVFRDGTWTYRPTYC